MKPDFVPRAQIEALRRERGFESRIAGLWTAGAPDGLGRPSVAIVGTRAATRYGSGIARAFAAELGAAGCCIVSGLALGIDAAAHEGALEGNAPTIGVLGGGHLHFFPKRNRALADRICASGGAVVSPYAPDVFALPFQFLERNAVVAALSDAVVVIEAPARSGAMNTAGHAAGRIPVLAVPGDIDRPQAGGCHALIRDGAILARSAADVLEAIGLRSMPETPRAPDAPRSDPLERAVLAALTGGEAGLDAIATTTGAAPGAILAALTMLELAGQVEGRDGNRYALTARRTRAV